MFILCRCCRKCGIIYSSKVIVGYKSFKDCINLKEVSFRENINIQFFMKQNSDFKITVIDLLGRRIELDSRLEYDGEFSNFIHLQNGMQEFIY